MKTRAKIAALLSPILEEPARTIEKKLTSTNHFVWIKRQLTDQQATEIEKLKAPGLNLTDEYKRFYPYRQVGGQVVGFVNIDGAGIEGVEKSFDDVLKASQSLYRSSGTAGASGCGSIRRPLPSLPRVAG